MKEFGLIGRTLSHSFSQTYFTHKFEQLGLTNYHYELFELPTSAELPSLLTRRPHLAGLNVTIPYKEQVWQYLDEVAPSAARVGAVNVIEFAAGGRLIGHNTDYVGFRESLRTFLPAAAPVQALVLGTGGAAKAVEVALQELGIAYQLVSRTPAPQRLTYAGLTPDVMAAHELLINTTPLGTYPQTDACPPIPYECLSARHYLYDLIYNPAETQFLARGRQAGAHTKNGFEMLGLQAEAAWQIWTSAQAQ